MKFALTDSRRLTGPNLFSDDPGAVADVVFDRSQMAADLPSRAQNAWQSWARRYVEAVGWTDSQVHTWNSSGVFSQYLSAPADVLYAATEVNEAAWASAVAEIDGDPPADFEATVKRLNNEINRERNPDLLALKERASKHGSGFLSDDDCVSVGYGPGVLTWPARDLPAPDAVPWDKVSNIPVGLVTGTNGKSTTVRLSSAILTAAGKCPGVTSTDYIRVGSEVIDSGDYSGPGGARTLLRDERVQVAVLEVARGGMLRRGLGVTRADAALVTNVAADHLGEFGINTVAELIRAKFIVRRALAPEKPLILNADDEGCVNYASSLRLPCKVWFSENANHPLIHSHCMKGGEAWVVSGGVLTRKFHQAQEPVVPVADIPITLNGAARYNVQNALAAAALCYALGAGLPAIAEGLQSFQGTPEENPGRGNFFEGNGIRVLVDFAHNEHGLSAIADTIARVPAQRRLVMMGQAGDRSDQLIEDLVQAALTARPDQLVIANLPGYERGRLPDEVSDLIHRLALQNGMSETQISHADDPVGGTRLALEWAKPGDFLLLLVLTQRGPCIQLVRRHLDQAHSQCSPQST